MIVLDSLTLGLELVRVWVRFGVIGSFCPHGFKCFAKVSPQNTTLTVCSSSTQLVSFFVSHHRLWSSCHRKSQIDLHGGEGTSSDKEGFGPHLLLLFVPDDNNGDADYSNRTLEESNPWLCCEG